MQIHELKLNKSKAKKRVGRGGKKGTYSGAGMKGQRSRAGFSQRATFGGNRGTNVLRVKKLRGFKSRNPKNQPVNLARIEKNFNDGEKVTPETLKEKGIIKKLDIPVKILAMGKLTKKVTFENVLMSEAVKKVIGK